MRFTQLLSGAAICLGLSTSVAAFSEGGNLPANHILYGPSGTGSDKGSKIEKRDTTTARVADAVCTNSPTSRNCWSSGYSVATDFDAKWPTTGVTRYYDLSITNTTCNPDGNGKKICFLLNGQYPGPRITASE